MEHSSSELDQLRATARAHTEQVADLAQRICAVPAPTGNEWQRAQFVATLLQQRGYLPDIDEIGNVYVRRGKRGQGPVLMILATVHVCLRMILRLIYSIIQRRPRNSISYWLRSKIESGNLTLKQQISLC